MTTKRHFWKYSANGNNFILLDHLQEGWEFSAQDIVNWCDAKFGIGADGVAQISPSQNPAEAFRFRLWNNDGGEAEMCGNAARAAAQHFADFHHKKADFSFKTLNAVYNVEFVQDQLWLNMSEKKVDISFNPEPFEQFKKIFYINTGVPHLVLEVPSLDTLNIEKVSPALRSHPIFPRGANVDYIQLVSRNPRKIKMRVFERGVEGETWSCGTGIAAVAWASQQFYGEVALVEIETKGGTHLVRFDQRGLWYSGTIKFSFEGNLP